MIQRKLLRGRGTSIINEVKESNKGQNTKRKKKKKKEHAWTRTHSLLVVNSVP